MGKLWTLLGHSIRKSDLFGAPVQLKYKGQTAFNTLCGGCMSILMIITLISFFYVELSRHYFYPTFQTFPTIYDYEDRTAYLNPATGNTLALKIPSLTISKLRIQFSTTDNNGTKSYIEAVYCTDLYAEQMELERNGTLATNYFTQMFSDDVLGNAWVCPNATAFEVGYDGKVSADVVNCETAHGDVYANNATCNQTTSGGFFVYMRLVSTHLKADDYFSYGQLQLYAEDHDKWVPLNKAVAVTTEVLENKQNSFRDNFFSFDATNMVNTT